jgi:lipopolysaccharide export system permease protein
MKKIDRYILGKFLGTFFLSLVLILSVAIVFDVSEKVEDFRKGATFNEIIFDYYLNFVAYYGNMFSAMIVFISTIWFSSRMTANTEIVAILTGGVSFRRLMYPYFLGALIVSLISLSLNHFVIPKTNIKRLKFEHTYVGSGYQEKYTQNIHRQIAPGRFAYFETFNQDRKSGYHFSFEVIEEGKLMSKLASDFVRYDTTSNKWRLDNWNLRIIHEDGSETITSGRRIDTALNFTPKEVKPRLYTTSMMNTPQLIDFIEKERIRGSENMGAYKIELHKRSSWPASTFVLILIAVSLCTKKTRGGLGLNMAIGLLLCGAYVFMTQISTTLATKDDFSPLLAVWLPNIVFGLIGIYLYRIAPK